MKVIEKPILERDLLESLSRTIKQEKQVILHVRYANTALFGSLIRIWKSSYLLEHETGNRSELIHAENISFFPVWTEIPPFASYEFTLVFSGLSEECNEFDFVELIPQSGGFKIPNIKRNKSDVYRVELIDL